MASQTDIDTVRDYVGDDDPDDLAIEELVDEMGSANLAAQRILERRYASLLTGPAKFGVTGYNEDNTAVIAALKERINELAMKTGVESNLTVQTAQMTRPGPSTRGLYGCLR